jgi:UDP-N-acetylmuramate dehydrogenase
MNAGCYGSEMWDIVESVVTVTRNGRMIHRPASDFETAYRHVALRSGAEEFFAAAQLRLRAGNGEEGRRVIRELLQRRIASQPLEQPNAGSVFRNPPGDYAARLIESCGLKAVHIGGAMVSPKHANFIVNTGSATAADIEALIEHVRDRVRLRTGVALEREVRIIGERA